MTKQSNMNPLKVILVIVLTTLILSFVNLVLLYTNFYGTKNPININIPKNISIAPTKTVSPTATPTATLTPTKLPIRILLPTKTPVK